MRVFDLHRTASDKVSPGFLGEVTLRSLYTFVLVFLFLKTTGRRGMRQMSLFEVLIILAPESAVGGAMFHDGMSMVPVLIVFTTLALLYRLVMWLMTHSEKLEGLLEDEPVVITEDDKLVRSKLSNSNMTEFESFVELRLCGVEQLEQVHLTILETNGQISVYFSEDDKVKPDLLTLPSDCAQRCEMVPESTDYACVRCSEVIYMRVGKEQLRPRCVNPEQTKTSRAKQVI